MAHLTETLFEALCKEFPFLKDLRPEIHSPSRPIHFQVKRELPTDLACKLELGRHNNDPTMEYHQGDTWVRIWNAAGELRLVNLDEGETRLGDLLRDGDRWALVKYSWRSELVDHQPGSATYTLYKDVTKARTQAVEEAARTAAQMRAELESGYPLG